MEKNESSVNGIFSLKENGAWNFQKSPVFVNLNILEQPRCSNIQDFLGTTFRYWLREYSGIFMKFQITSFAQLLDWNFVDILE